MSLHAPDRGIYACAAYGNGRVRDVQIDERRKHDEAFNFYIFLLVNLWSK